MSRNTSDNGRINRRQFLTATGTTATVGFLGTQNAVADDRVERTYGYRFTDTPQERAAKRRNGQQPEFEEVTYTIPRSQWGRVESARDAARKLSSELSDLNDTGRIAVGVTNQYDHDGSKKRIVVDYNVTIEETADGDRRVLGEPNVSFERVEREAPYTIKGVADDGNARDERELEVEVRRIEETPDHSCDSDQMHYDDFHEDVPGGALMSGVDSRCTSCMPGWHSDYGYVIASSGHCFNEQGAAIEQPYSAYGYVEEYYDPLNKNNSPWPVDISVIEESTYRGWDYSLADSDGTKDESIVGWMDWQTIVDMHDQEFWPMKRQGRQTGRCQGIVTEYYTGDTIRHFDTSANRGGGDSGGPHFTLDSNGDAMIGGLHRAEHRETGDARASYIEDLYNYIGLSF